MEKSELQELAEAVYEIVGMIPRGRATSYAALAKAIGRPNHSRLIGWLMRRCPAGTPAHRVVNSQGILSAREAFETPTRMQERLEEEGVAVSRHRIENWKKVFWNPLDEL